MPSNPSHIVPSLSKHTTPPKQSRTMFPLSTLTFSDDSNTSLLEPSDDETDSVEVEEEEWSDEQLMDDARPGRRVKVEKREHK
jgi:hypothetical protein